MNMKCDRGKDLPSFKVGDRKFVHPGGTIVVSTNDGPLIAIMKKKPDPTPEPIVPTKSIDIGGAWTYAGKPSTPPASVALVPNTKSIVFTNERGDVSQGIRLSETTAQAYGWNMFVQILDEGKVLVFQNGTWWHRNAFDKIVSKSNRPLADSNWRYMTGPCVVSGPDENLSFRNQRGDWSPGKLLDSSTVQAWGGMLGKLSMDRSAILWANGTVWTRY